MSRHEDDGGDGTTSDGDDEFRNWVDEAAGADAAAGDEGTNKGGWIGRVLGRGQADEEAPEQSAATEGDSEHDPRLGDDPDSLSVFSAVQFDDEDDADDEYEEDGDDIDLEDDAGDEEDAFEDAFEDGFEDGFEDDAGDEYEEDGDDIDLEDDAGDEDGFEDGFEDDAGDEDGFEDDSIEDDETEASADLVDDEAEEGELDTDEVDAGEDASEEDWESVDTGGAEEVVADADVLELPQTEPIVPDGDDSEGSSTGLWDSDDVDDEDIIDFASFTSEDYVQATTREYAGLAEAVARAEEEDTQRIAVSAEIPGLESGIVGLEDVVHASGGGDSADVVEPPSASDLPMRVLTALGLVILFGASLLSPYGIGALIVVVLGIAAGEMYSALIRSGYRPLSIFGFAGIGGAFFGTWAAGPIAVPIALILGAIAVFLFYATVPGRRAVLENATLTLLVMAWIGGLGGLAFDLLGSDQYQWLVLALVITVAAMDIVQYFVGRRIGKRQLAAQVSPKKTVEGYIAGVFAALAVGAAFGLTEPFDVTDGLIIGAVVAVIAPLGDLAVSVLKRALGVKDMGYILPGHGGVLDRVDAMIMTIPALWLAYSWMGLVN